MTAPRVQQLDVGGFIWEATLGSSRKPAEPCKKCRLPKGCYREPLRELGRKGHMLHSRDLSLLQKRARSKKQDARSKKGSKPSKPLQRSQHSAQEEEEAANAASAAPTVGALEGKAE